MCKTTLKKLDGKQQEGSVSNDNGVNGDWSDCDNGEVVGFPSFTADLTTTIFPDSSFNAAHNNHHLLFATATPSNIFATLEAMNHFSFQPSSLISACPLALAPIPTPTPTPGPAFFENDPFQQFQFPYQFPQFSLTFPQFNNELICDSPVIQPLLVTKLENGMSGQSELNQIDNIETQVLPAQHLQTTSPLPSSSPSPPLSTSSFIEEHFSSPSSSPPQSLLPKWFSAKKSNLNRRLKPILPKTPPETHLKLNTKERNQLAANICPYTKIETSKKCVMNALPIREDKKERNRLASEKYRKKSRDLISILEHTCSDLTKKNEALKNRNTTIEEEIEQLNQLLFKGHKAK